MYDRVVCEVIIMRRTTIILCLCVCVCVAYHNVGLYINRVRQLFEIGPIIKSINKTAEYHYLEGDQVDVTCISQNMFCHAEIEYDDLAKLIEVNETFTISSHDSYTYNGVGLRTTLWKTHSHTRVSCQFACGISEVSLHIVFISNNTFDDKLNFKINGYPIRFQDPEDNTLYTVCYFKDKYVKFEHASKVVASYQWRSKTYAITKKTYEIIPNVDYSLKYEIIPQNETVAIQRRVFYVEFEMLQNELYDKALFAVTNSSYLLELYQFKGEDSITFKCNASDEFIFSHNNNGWMYGDSLDEELKAENNKKLLKCGLSVHIGRNVKHVSYYRKTDDIYGTFGECVYCLAAVVVGVMCLLVCIIVTVWCMKRNRRKLSGPGPADSVVFNEDPINYNCQNDAPHSADAYQDFDNTAYSNVCMIRDPGPEEAVDQTYANLDLTFYAKVVKKFTIEEPPYAEVRKEKRVIK